MAQDNDRRTTGQGGSWRKWLLVASLGVNLMVGGLVAGALLRGGPDGRHPRLDLTVGPLTRAMTAEHRDALRVRLRDQGAFDARDRRAIRSDMQALLGVLRAETFDADAFRDVLVRQRARMQSGQDAVMNAVAEQIGGMSLGQRSDFADRLEDQMRRDRPAPTRDRSGG